MGKSGYASIVCTLAAVAVYCWIRRLDRVKQEDKPAAPLAAVAP